MVIEAEEMQDGGVEVANVDGVGAYAVAEFVGFAVGDAGFHSPASHPDDEGVGIPIKGLSLFNNFGLKQPRSP